jgi:hypothetical protein
MMDWIVADYIVLLKCIDVPIVASKCKTRGFHAAVTLLPTSHQPHIFINVDQTLLSEINYVTNPSSPHSYHSSPEDPPQLFGIYIENDRPDSSGIINAHHWEQHHELCDSDGIIADRLSHRDTLQ